MTFAEFISERGVRPLAVAFGVPETTIYSWSYRNCIPRKRWDRLMELYPRLKWQDLRRMESHSISERV